MSDSLYLTFDTTGVPDAVIDLVEVRGEVDALYATLLGKLTAHGDTIADAVAQAVAASGPAGGLVAVNTIIKLMRSAIAPLAVELGRQGMTPAQVLALIQSEAVTNN
ncbi:hypothetical protein [Rhodococcoides fascians]|uniref:hypothetical protein n=1 Tax=Rhodococcoides fascians TaxID=1828 RepID=UPI00050BF49C|nr:hypothetical protein [Rhodococcus fascians]